MTAELEDVARYWLEDVGVDGFRLDAVKHFIEDGKDAQVNTPETLAWLAGFKDDGQGRRVRMRCSSARSGIRPSIAGSYVPDSLDMTFDFGLATGMRLAIQNQRAAPLRTALTESLAAWPANQQASFLTNHDQDRIMSQLYGDLPSAKLAAFLLLTAPGTPFVYYGEEIGMTGVKPDERIRTPMRWTADAPAAGFSTAEPWQPLSDDPPEVNVATQLADPDSLLRVYGDLVRVRSQQVALREGATHRRRQRRGARHRLAADDRRPDRARARQRGRRAGRRATRSRSRDGPLCGAQVATLIGSVGGDAGAHGHAPDGQRGRWRGRLDAARAARAAKWLSHRPRARPVSDPRAGRGGTGTGGTRPAHRPHAAGLPTDDPGSKRPSRPVLVEVATALLIVAGFMSLFTSLDAVIAIAGTAGTRPRPAGPVPVHRGRARSRSASPCATGTRGCSA